MTAGSLVFDASASNFSFARLVIVQSKGMRRTLWAELLVTKQVVQLKGTIRDLDSTRACGRFTFGSFV